MTIVAKTNWRIDIVKLFDKLSITEYSPVVKKRGRRPKNSVEQILQKVNDGSIICLKLGTTIKGNEAKKKYKKTASGKTNKKVFGNCLILVMQVLGKFINVKVCSNGCFHITGAKSIEHVVMFLKFFTESVESIGDQKILQVMDLKLNIKLITVMTNINFNIGYLVDREKLNDYFKEKTDYNSYFIISGEYAGVIIQMPLGDNMPIYKVLYDSQTKDWSYVTESYEKYISDLDYKEVEKINNKQRCNKLFVFANGSTILTSSHVSCMKSAYIKFMEIMREGRSKIEERIN